MIGMTREQIEHVVDEWYENNRGQMSTFFQSLNLGSDCGDDVIDLVTGVMASVGTTIALSAIKDILVRNNELINTQINDLVDAKIAQALKK